ncbi:MAG: hypothetical protein Kow0088_20360 [Anaerolineales bacterium]
MEHRTAVYGMLKYDFSVFANKEYFLLSPRSWRIKEKRQLTGKALASVTYIEE